MLEWFASLAPVYQALIGTLFTWGMTALGAALVFTTKNVNQKFLDSMLGFAAGVMIAASYWSLLAPAIEMSEGKSTPAWVPAAVRVLHLAALAAALGRVLVSNRRLARVLTKNSRRRLRPSLAPISNVAFSKKSGRNGRFFLSLVGLPRLQPFPPDYFYHVFCRATDPAGQPLLSFCVFSGTESVSCCKFATKYLRSAP